MKTLILAVCLALTGCAQLGDMWFNPQDPCQKANKPNYCGASGTNAVVTRDYYRYSRPVYSSQYEKF